MKPQLQLSGSSGVDTHTMPFQSGPEPAKGGSTSLQSLPEDEETDEFIDIKVSHVYTVVSRFSGLRFSGLSRFSGLFLLLTLRGIRFGFKTLRIYISAHFVSTSFKFEFSFLLTSMVKEREAFSKTKIKGRF